MSEAPADVEEIDEDHGSPIPEPPRRVPFGVAVTAVLLGLLALPLAVLATVTLFSGETYRNDVGEAALRGLGAAAVAGCAALVLAVAWSFVRDGNTAGPMAVGSVAVLTSLILLVAGVSGDGSGAEWVRLGVLTLVLGVAILLVPLAGHGPAYLAARRVWAGAERDWLRELTTPDPLPPHQQQWPGHPQQQWGAAPQGYQAPPGYPGQPPQYQYGYPPQPAPDWSGHHPQQFQAWPGQPTMPPAQPPAPPAAAQQAPTEQIRPADPEPPRQ